MSNISEYTLSIMGSRFIHEFNIYCNSRDIENSPTIKAMNSFTEDEWKDFKSWIDFRKTYTYEDIVSWDWDSEMENLFQQVNY